MQGWRVDDEDGGLVHIEAVKTQPGLQVSTATLEKLVRYAGQASKSQQYIVAHLYTKYVAHQLPELLVDYH